MAIFFIFPCISNIYIIANDYDLTGKNHQSKADVFISSYNKFKKKMKENEDSISIYLT
jgi:hypothetical protein